MFIFLFNLLCLRQKVRKGKSYISTMSLIRLIKKNLYNYNEFTHNKSQYFMQKCFLLYYILNDSFINIYLLITIFYAYLLYINKTL